MFKKYAFPNGRVAVIIEPAPTKPTVQWQDMDGNITGWGDIQNVEYAPTLGEQFLVQRGVAA
jgi:hypothetical protein